MFGVIRVTKEILPIMRKQRHGTIVNIISVATYVSSKFALEGLSESIAYEVEQFGINVILIEPGVIKTNFDSNLKMGNGVSSTTTTTSTAHGRDSPYADITKKELQDSNLDLKLVHLQ